MTPAFDRGWLGPLAVLLALGCSGQASPLIEISVNGMPDGTRTLRATSFLNQKPEQDPAEFTPPLTRFIVRLPAGAMGTYRLEVEALADDLCSFAEGAGETTINGMDPIPLAVSFGPPLDIHICSLEVKESGAGEGYVQSAPSGIDCGGSAAQCTAHFQQGIQVVLTATPDGNSTFEGWAGSCSSLAACVLRMDGPASVAATFGVHVP